MYTRREWGKLALAAVGGASATGAARSADRAGGRIDSIVDGVRFGAQSYSFRDLPLADMLDIMREVGLGTCELWSGHTGPGELWRNAGSDPRARGELRRWRLSVPLAEFSRVREQFDRAGIELCAFNLSMRDDFTDAEIARAFEMARALRVPAMTSSSNIATVKRIDPYARRYKMPVGLHNHSSVGNSNEFSNGASFERGLRGASPYMRINLDVGHFTAADDDPVAYLRAHHKRIVTLHIKDRKRDAGATTPFGEGDAPLGAVLKTLSLERWRIPANIEYEYAGTDAATVRAELRRSFEFCKRELAKKG